MADALVCGAGGFIGGHLVRRLRAEGFRVRGVDLKWPEFAPTAADEFVIGDLRDADLCRRVVDRDFDEVYQLAADMGGAGYIFSGDHDADLMHNSATINLNMLEACRARGVRRVFYSSSACIYPARNQEDPDNPNCAEDSAYPAAPDSEYGWEKLFSERLYFAYQRNHRLPVRVARLHNVFGPQGTWTGGREKAPAALCRKVAAARDGEAIEIWGDGTQTRSFLYIDEALEGIVRLMRSDCPGPLNIGSAEMIGINDLARLVMRVAGKQVAIRNVPGPIGVRGRTSDNRRIRAVLGWEPTATLEAGIRETYRWIERQVQGGAAPGNAASDAAQPVQQPA
jgi:nucleoside-diphosphate-sugar epimerase